MTFVALLAEPTDRPALRAGYGTGARGIATHFTGTPEAAFWFVGISIFGSGAGQRWALPVWS
ncbi:hypothetical protein [Alkalilacustris brevis]|uniref:hypothetical protein n=1 Tax=Alkalilacustris brevis TaxID=2026338 RepID=UPI000E0CC1BA|nr:hypothetical protein [Alkalilacustris brevis]